MDSSIKEFVRKKLEAHVRYRDSHALIYSDYLKEVKGINTAQNTIRHLLILISEGKVAPMESIQRASNKLKEEFPELRGSDYQARKNKEAEYRRHYGKK